MSVNSEAEIAKLAEVFSEDLAQLACMHALEPSAELLEQLREISFPHSLGVKLQTPQALGAVQRLSQGLANLPLNIDRSVLDVLAVDFADIYLNHTFAASPYESVWIDDDHLALQEPTFAVRRYYAHYNLKASNWRVRSEDHLVAELEFLSFLLQTTDAERYSAAARFLDDHLLRWAPDFFGVISQRAATVYFSALAELSSAYLEELRSFLELATLQARPSKAEIDARMKPKRSGCIAAAPLTPSCGSTV